MRSGLDEMHRKFNSSVWSWVKFLYNGIADLRGSLAMWGWALYHGMCFSYLYHGHHACVQARGLIRAAFGCMVPMGVYTKFIVC